MQNMEKIMDSVVVLQELKTSIENFLMTSQEEFIKSGYQKIVQESQKGKRNTPFLSVIVRTQGKREESLREVFLCLEGQENQDFEVVLIGHKLNAPQESLVRTIVEQQSPNLQEKIRFLKLDYGNRTTPLNIGFARAWGEYIVTLDDDDIVLDNWVSNFYKAAKEYPGKVLYNYAFAQNWSVIDGGDFDGGLRAESAFDSEFAHDFNDVTQVELNRCPPVGLAYPASAFQKMGIIFDESLATTEDWDYLMRVAYVCGVYSINETACIYRKWINAETSFTVHKKEEWERNYNTIVEKICKKMLCLPVGGASTIYQLIKDRSWLLGRPIIDTYAQHIFGLERLYFCTEQGYSEEAAMQASEMEVNNVGGFRLAYWVDEKYSKIKKFRWDPIEKGTVLIKNLKVTNVYEYETEIVVPEEKVTHNGKKVGEYILFMQDDPQIYVENQESDKLTAIIIQGNVREDMPKEVYEKLIEEERGNYIREMNEKSQNVSLVEKVKAKILG